MIKKEKARDILYNVITSEINDINGDFDTFVEIFKEKEIDEIIEIILYGILRKYEDKINEK